MQLTERLSSFERGSEYNAHKNQNTVDLQKEIENLRREVTKQWSSQTSPIAMPYSSFIKLYKRPILFWPPYSVLEPDILGLRIIYREILTRVPKLDRENASLPEFMRACHGAREMVPPSAERDLTKFLVNGLSREAYGYAVKLCNY